MSDGVTPEKQEAAERRRTRGGRALEGGLEAAIAHAGAVLTGLSIKIGPDETMIVVKAVLAGRPQVTFVASSDLLHAVLKAERDARADKLSWRADKWAK